MLFDKKSRTYIGPKFYFESEFDYLNRSGRKVCERIRCLLEDWLSHYPTDKKKELINRVRNSDDIGYFSAFFELYLHELLLNLRYQVVIHPNLKEESTHPEFLVTRDKKKIFILEATLALSSQDEIAAEKRENVVYDTINKMDSPNFFIGLEMRGTPNTPVPGAKWRRFLGGKISKLNPDQVASLLEIGGLKALPRWRRTHDGWDITFVAIPKSPKTRGKKGIRPIGYKTFRFRKLEEHEYIRKAIKEKATKYGELNLPYIIAINVMSIFKDDAFIKDALFGREGIMAFRKPDGTFVHRPERSPNGIWRGPKGPQNTRNSAVLISWYLLPRNVVKETPILWHNPWAKNSLGENIWPLPQRKINKQSGSIETKEGINAGKVFNLPNNWPMIDDHDEY